MNETPHTHISLAFVQDTFVASVMKIGQRVWTKLCYIHINKQTTYQNNEVKTGPYYPQENSVE